MTQGHIYWDFHRAAFHLLPWLHLWNLKCAEYHADLLKTHYNCSHSHYFPNNNGGSSPSDTNTYKFIVFYTYLEIEILNTVLAFGSSHLPKEALLKYWVPAFCLWKRCIFNFDHHSQHCSNEMLPPVLRNNTTLAPRMEPTILFHIKCASKGSRSSCEARGLSSADW